MERISNYDIIKKLLEHGRKSYSEIAEELNVTEATIRKRVKKMKKEGIIKKFTVVVNPEKIGYKIRAIIGFDIDEKYYTDIILRLESREEIINLMTATGDHMVLLEAWFKDIRDLHNFEQELSSLEGITDICPAIIVEQLK